MKVSVKLLNGESKVKAFASVTLELPDGNISINGLKLIDPGDSDYFVAFPSRSYEKSGETKYSNIVFVSGDLRDIISDNVVAAYNEVVDKSKPKKSKGGKY